MESGEERPRRYELLDSLRGVALVSMILYHFLWDCVYLFHLPVSWFSGSIGDLWQKSICYTFILLSGFCSGIGRHPVKRGWIVTAAGALITIVTLLVTPRQRVLFGVLTLLGASMLITGASQKVLKKIPPVAGVIGCLLLFWVWMPAGDGYVNWFFKDIPLPKTWYHGYLGAFFGFPPSWFFSTDYFPLFPWVFLFLTGYFLYHWIGNSSGFRRYGTLKIPLFSKVGKNSLLVYMIHQPVLYGGLLLWEELFA